MPGPGLPEGQGAGQAAMAPKLPGGSECRAGDVARSPQTTPSVRPPSPGPWQNYIQQSCEPIRPASALDLDTNFALLRGEQRELKDQLQGWQSTIAQQLQTHRLGLEEVVLEQTTEQSRQLQHLSERLDQVLRRLETTLQGLQGRLKEVEEAHARRLEQLLGKLAHRSGSPRRGRSTLMMPSLSLLQSPRSRASSASSEKVGESEVTPTSRMSDSTPTRPAGRHVAFEAQTTSCESPCKEEVVLEEHEAALSPDASRAKRLSFFRSLSWPSNLRKGGTTREESFDSPKLHTSSPGNFAASIRQTASVTWEVERLAASHSKDGCWWAFLMGLAGSLRWLENLQEPERHGALATVVRSRTFTALSIGFIFFDAILTAYSSNYLIENLTLDRTQGMIVMEACILAFYFLEIFLKLLLHRAYFFLSEDWRWNVTDMIVVLNSSMVLFGKYSDVNLSFVRVCRVFRITRIFLLVRAVGFVKQMRVMMECVLNCFLNLFWCIVLVVFISFIFALFLVQHMTQYLINEDDTHFKGDTDMLLFHFGSVQRTLLTLFKVATGGDDWDVFYRMIVPTGGLGPPLFLFFVAFFTIAVWNIITSLFVETAMSRVHPTTRELMVEKQKQDLADVKELSQLFLTIDTDDSNNISREEFLRFTEDTEAMEALQVRGLDIKEPQVFFEMLTAIDSNDHKVGQEEFVDGCLKMRGPASCLDVHAVKFEMTLLRRSVSRALRSVARRLEGLERG